MGFLFHVHTLKVDFLEDYLMKIFMITLEEDARSWYESRPLATISSIKDFYLVFCKRYGKHHLSLELIEMLCGYFKGLMLHLGWEVDDRASINDDIEEAPLESDCQSSCSSEDSVSELCIQEEHVQEVVSLDTSEE